MQYPGEINPNSKSERAVIFLEYSECQPLDGGRNNTIAMTVYAGPFWVSLVCAPEFNLLNLVFSIPSAWWHLLCAPKTAAQESTGKVTVSWLCF